MKYLFYLLLVFLVSSCISLKSEYPDIQFYQLNQEPSTSNNNWTIDGTLQIRSFTIAEQLNTDHFLAAWDDTKIQNYFYHRWITPCPDLVTDFIVNRFNNFKAFKGGTVKSQTMLVPDYILEGHILDMIAHNSTKKEDGSNFVSISIQINLIKREPLKNENTLLLTKVFSASATRANSEVINIAPAFSKAISQISDKILADIHDSVTKSEAK